MTISQSLPNRLFDMAPRHVQKRITAIVNAAIEIRYSADEVLYMQQQYSGSGRTYQEHGNLLTPFSGSKVTKLLSMAVPFKPFTLTIKGITAILYHLGGYEKAFQLASPKDKWLNGCNLVSWWTGLIDEASYIAKIKKSELKVKEGATKGWETVEEVRGLIHAWNNAVKISKDPTVPVEALKYAYVIMDAKAQNWSIYAGLFRRERKLMAKLNLHVGETRDALELPTLDFNSVNAGIFKTKLNLTNVTGLRDYVKYVMMVIGFGGGMSTANKKAVAETGNHDLSKVFTENEAKVMESIEEIVPGFNAFLNGILRYEKSVNTTYAYDIGGMGFAYGKLGKVVTEHQIQFANGQSATRYESTRVELSADQPGGGQRFKVAFTTHNLDAYLVRFTRNYMHNVFRVSIDTNHDSQASHPEFAWDMADAHIIGFKTLYAMNNGNILSKQLDIWSNGLIKEIPGVRATAPITVQEYLDVFPDGAEKVVMTQRLAEMKATHVLVDDAVPVEEFVNTPNEYFLNYIWNY